MNVAGVNRRISSGVKTQITSRLSGDPSRVQATVIFDPSPQRIIGHHYALVFRIGSGRLCTYGTGSPPRVFQW